MNQATPYRGFDLHCHLDLFPDHQAAIRNAEAARVFTLAVTTTPRAWPRNKELCAGSPYVHAAVGLHPQLVADLGHELPLWRALMSETRFIGEVGLDAGPRFYQSFDLQKKVFRTVLEDCATIGDRILSVHSIRSAASVLQLIESHLPSELGTVVLHWFTGTLTEARRAVDLGCYFSVNMPMTQTAKGRALIASLPIDRILSETDGPFTTANRGAPSCPADVVQVPAEIAKIRGGSADDILRAIANNLQTLVKGAEPFEARQ
ncbi:Qat anti-phage system TatD family nuclease QatD [Mycolicibacterium gadium]|uniref:Qat anti-phage system TatD family nuclease QatD n=1 Tax=Mycolicibacterium gadium TaxID=1794 RepID=UPI00384C2A36